MPTENDMHTATSPSQWRGGRKFGFVVDLPSGNKARIRRTLSMIDMVKSGTVPNPLQAQIQTMLQAGRDQRPLEMPDIKDFKEEQWASLFSMIDEEIPHIFVEPRVELVPAGENPQTWQPEDENAISIVDIDFKDRIYVYNIAQGGPVDLARFLASQEAVAALANGQGVRGETEPTAGDK